MVRYLWILFILVGGFCLKAGTLFADGTNIPAGAQQAPLIYVYQPPVVAAPVAPAPAPVAPVVEVTKTTSSGTPSVLNNNITINTPGGVYGPQPAVALASPPTPVPANAVSAVMGPQERGPYLSITPAVGMSLYMTQWFHNAKNDHTFGLIVEVPVTSHVSLEAEGHFGQFFQSYQASLQSQQQPQQQQQQQAQIYSHPYNQYGANGNVKVSLNPGGVFIPYIGAGLGGLYYEGMDRGPSEGGMQSRYNQWIGVGQAFAGLEIAPARSVAFGLRGTYVRGLWNRPYTMSDGITSAPGFEDAGLMNTDFVRVMGTLRLSL